MDYDQIFFDGPQKKYLAALNRELLSAATDHDASRQAAASQAIDRLAGLLRGCRCASVDRVHVGGSFGRRTHVAGEYDVDLSVFVNDFPGSKPGAQHGSGVGAGWDTVQQQRSIRQKVRDWLQQNGYESEVLVEAGSPYQCAIKLVVRAAGGLHIDVDLMILPNYARERPSGDSPAHRQRDVLALPVHRSPGSHQPDRIREASLAEALAEVVKARGDKVKSVVRLLKAWYKYGLRDRGLVRDVPSVLLEVVVLAAEAEGEGQEKALFTCTAPYSEGPRLLLAALRLLRDAARGDREVALEAGGKWGYSRATAERCRHAWRDDKVVVLHPIDPTCNLAAVRGGKERPNWQRLAAEAESFRAVVLRRSLGELLRGPAVAAMRARLAEAAQATRGGDGMAGSGSTCSSGSEDGPATWRELPGVRTPGDEARAWSECDMRGAAGGARAQEDPAGSRLAKAGSMLLAVAGGAFALKQLFAP